jgi:hypothetical protein
MLEKFKNDVEKQQAEQMMGWQAKLVKYGVGFSLCC